MSTAQHQYKLLHDPTLPTPRIVILTDENDHIPTCHLLIGLPNHSGFFFNPDISRLGYIAHPLSEPEPEFALARVDYTLLCQPSPERKNCTDYSSYVTLDGINSVQRKLIDEQTFPFSKKRQMIHDDKERSDLYTGIHQSLLQTADENRPWPGPHILNVGLQSFYKSNFRHSQDTLLRVRQLPQPTDGTGRQGAHQDPDSIKYGPHKWISLAYSAHGGVEVKGTKILPIIGFDKMGNESRGFHRVPTQTTDADTLPDPSHVEALASDLWVLASEQDKDTAPFNHDSRYFAGEVDERLKVWSSAIKTFLESASYIR